MTTDLRDDDAFEDMVELPVSKFMAQNSQDLCVAAPSLFLLLTLLFILLCFLAVLFWLIQWSVVLQ